MKKLAFYFILGCICTLIILWYFAMPKQNPILLFSHTNIEENFIYDAKIVQKRSALFGFLADKQFDIWISKRDYDYGYSFPMNFSYDEIRDNCSKCIIVWDKNKFEIKTTTGYTVIVPNKLYEGGR
jgi:hypothetical protein